MKLINRSYTYFITLLLLIIAGVFTTGCGGDEKKEASTNEMKFSVMGRLKSCQELVTTRLQLRSIQTICIDNGNISLNPKTWHIDRLNNIMVVLPLDVTVNYGYDLNDMQVDIVKTDDDKSEVWVYLPEPKILNKTYNPAVPKETEIIPADANPDQGQISRGMQIAFQQVIKDFDASLYKVEAENNAKAVFEDILKDIDFKFTRVHIANIKDRH